MNKLNYYIVVTYTSYNVIVRAENEADAVRRANVDYAKRYDDIRDDFSAVLLSDFLEDEDNNAFPVRAFEDYTENAITAIVSSFWAEYELYKTGDVDALLKAIKKGDTSNFKLIGCQDDFTPEIARKIADNVLYIDDILDD